MRIRAFLVAGLIAGLGGGVPALAADGRLAIPKQCAVPADLLRSQYSLPKVTAKLERGEPVRIVAIGSSSTAGTGASSAKATYPAQLEADLEALYPGVQVTMINRGIPGDTADTMKKRFKRDAIDPKPDLIIWQTGTNSALGGGDVERFTSDVIEGIRMARKHRIEIMLMGPQFAPRFESVTNRMSYLDHLRTIAALERVPIFPRYEVMKHWIQSGQFTTTTMINPDGLHLTDSSYGCLGWLVARMIGNPAVETARAAR
jgi:lysophospholipase L1-like esterase